MESHCRQFAFISKALQYTAFYPLWNGTINISFQAGGCRQVDSWQVGVVLQMNWLNTHHNTVIRTA